MAAISSYVWINLAGAHSRSNRPAEERVNVPASPARFKRQSRRDPRQGFLTPDLLKQPESLLGLSGPTLISCFLPFFFIGGWIYLGWYALHAAACNFQQDRSGNASSA